MKTRRISLITFLTLMIACFCIAILGLNVNKANAAVVESVGYKDTFDSFGFTISFNSLTTPKNGSAKHSFSNTKLVLFVFIFMHLISYESE